MKGYNQEWLKNLGNWRTNRQRQKQADQALNANWSNVPHMDHKPSADTIINQIEGYVPVQGGPMYKGRGQHRPSPRPPCPPNPNRAILDAPLKDWKV